VEVELLPVVLERHEENEHWKIKDFLRGEKIEDFTMHVWISECKKCLSVYEYTIGVDLESDTERTIKFRKPHIPLKSKL
jgi:hypothetical protein